MPVPLVFCDFQSKEDILFCDEPAFFKRLKQTLEQRPPGVTTTEALRDFLVAAAAPDDNLRLRKKIVGSDEGNCGSPSAPALHASSS